MKNKTIIFEKERILNHRRFHLSETEKEIIRQIRLSETALEMIRRMLRLDRCENEGEKNESRN